MQGGGGPDIYYGVSQARLGDTVLGARTRAKWLVAHMYDTLRFALCFEFIGMRVR